MMDMYDYPQTITAFDGAASDIDKLSLFCCWQLWFLALHYKKKLNTVFDFIQNQFGDLSDHQFRRKILFCPSRMCSP